MTLANWTEQEDVQPFDLQFKGKLRADQNSGPERTEQLHKMRLEFHRQLPSIWSLHPMARRLAELGFPVPLRGEMFGDATGRQFRRDYDWAKIQRRGIDFIPFVIRGANLSMICELDLRLRWREKGKGGIVRGFDIDSRIKGILDALSVPPEDNQLPKDLSAAPNPFLCLLENDNQITRLLIEASPLKDSESITGDDARIEFQVDVRVFGDGPEL